MCHRSTSWPAARTCRSACLADRPSIGPRLGPDRNPLTRPRRERPILHSCCGCRRAAATRTRSARPTGYGSVDGKAVPRRTGDRVRAPKRVPFRDALGVVMHGACGSLEAGVPAGLAGTSRKWLQLRVCRQCARAPRGVRRPNGEGGTDDDGFGDRQASQAGPAACPAPGTTGSRALDSTDVSLPVSADQAGPGSCTSGRPAPDAPEPGRAARPPGREARQQLTTREPVARRNEAGPPGQRQTCSKTRRKLPPKILATSSSP